MIIYAEIHRKLGDSFSLPGNGVHFETGDKIDEEAETKNPNYFYGPSPFLAEDDEVPHDIPVADYVDANGNPILKKSLTDVMIGSEVLLPQGEKQKFSKVIRQVVDKNGTTIGNHAVNPLLNTFLYNVEFLDGAVRRYVANIIACDADGLYTNSMATVLDHKRDGTSVPMSEKYFTTKHGKRTMRRSTEGWSFHIKWRDGTTSWVDLKDLKETNPVDIAEYATARRIQDEPAFAWWLPYTLRKLDVIVSVVSSRVRKCSQKYGFEIFHLPYHMLRNLMKRMETTFGQMPLGKR